MWQNVVNSEANIILSIFVEICCSTEGYHVVHTYTLVHLPQFANKPSGIAPSSSLAPRVLRHADWEGIHGAKGRFCWSVDGPITLSWNSIVEVYAGDMQILHPTRFTYSTSISTQLPIVDGMVPVNWLVWIYLQQSLYAQYIPNEWVERWIMDGRYIWLLVVNDLNSCTCPVDVAATFSK